MKALKKRGLHPRIFERTLIYVPIIHTLSDMGALGESVRRSTLMKIGKQSMNRKLDLINNVWTEIEKVINGLVLPYENVRLYQDGLPVCGKEVQIVTELAKTGSRNHQLLARLMKRGAKLMGTESSDLLVEEYELINQMLSAGNIPEKGMRTARQKDGGTALQKRAADQLLKKRDRYIAGRINTTLGKGETGILFLGMLHSPQSLLDRNIRVIYPVRRILFQGGYAR